LDEDDDALREIRLAHLLHVGTGFNVAVSREQCLAMAFTNGRLSVTNVDAGGSIAEGAPADLLLLNWNALDEDCLRTDPDVISLLFARATAKHIRELIVGGRTVVRNQSVLGIDFPAARAEVIAQMRAGMDNDARLVAALPALHSALRAYYEPDCC
jgi:cytosine/adenosine deaminase-related metal-dependent hydrolase